MSSLAVHSALIARTHLNSFSVLPLRSRTSHCVVKASCGGIPQRITALRKAFRWRVLNPSTWGWGKEAEAVRASGLVLSTLADPDIDFPSPVPSPRSLLREHTALGPFSPLCCPQLEPAVEAAAYPSHFGAAFWTVDALKV